MLFRESEVGQIFRLRAEAAKALGSSSGTGVGVFGAPSLELAAEAAALGLLSRIATAAAQKAGLEYLQQAQEKADALRSNGAWIRADEIQNLHFPIPEMWHAFHGTQRQGIDIGSMPKAEKRDFLERHGLAENAWMAGHWYEIDVPVKFIHSGDDFIRARDASGEIFFRWSHVCSYSAR
jgi:hypothetical protein